MPVLPPNSPYLQPQKEHKEITIDPKQFDVYVGRYQATPEIVLTITREGNQFFAQITGQPKLEIFAESEQNFFMKAVEVELGFEVDFQKRATAVFLHQLGREQRLPRIEGEPQQAWFGHKQIQIDPKILDGYAGTYQVDANDVVFTNEEGHLFMKSNPLAPKIEIFPAAERIFFLKVFDSQFTFEVDGQGRATAVIVRANGKEQHVPRKQ